MLKDSPLLKPLVAVVCVFILVMLGYLSGSPNTGLKTEVKSSPATKEGQVAKFASEADFSEFIKKSLSPGRYFADIGIRSFETKNGVAFEKTLAPSAPLAMDHAAQTAEAERFSGTNVQVEGIDEPDLVKTDGKNIYYASEPRFYIMPEAKTMEEISAGAPFKAILPPIPPKDYGTVRAIKARPLEEMKVLGKIQKTGQLMLSGKNLVVISDTSLSGYDISDPESPKETWNINLENDGYLAASRLHNGKLYLVTKNRIQYDRPCPVRPLSIKGSLVEILCTDIYHPASAVAEPSTFHAFRINPASGEVEDKLAFLGSNSSSVVYMSENFLYITYFQPQDEIDFMARFFKEKGADLLPAEALAKIERLQSYDISQNAKMLELETIQERHLNSVDRDERKRLESEMENRMRDYYKLHSREIEKTGITKISLDNFSVTASGLVPGIPLNQFSIDEHKGSLRIAVTIGGRWSPVWRIGGTTASTNDVYVLGQDLEVKGQVKDLGLTESIYSARFIGDKGYLVTFRQTDPFYVLDLSNPENPEMKGELKIPGFSSYLHPLEENLILGIGMEAGRIKLSLFDVNDPSSPKEAFKYSLDAYWSEVSSNHRAFLQDKKHKIFFMPAGGSGYVFNYENSQLKLVKVAGDIQAKRALFIGDTLYVVGESEIAAYDQKNWEKLKTLKME